MSSFSAREGMLGGLELLPLVKAGLGILTLGLMLAPECP